MPIESRAQVCARFQVKPYPCVANHKVGISRNVKEGVLPIVGLRLPSVGDTTGWYIFAGKYSADPDFYVPICVEHLPEWCPSVDPYLELPPGWRFIIAPDHEDVWFDDDLLRRKC